MSVASGLWECMGCFLLFSWDAYHKKAVYGLGNEKIEKPACGGYRPSECPECKHTEINNIE